ncbi:iron-sulfur cluster assembly accessory protein [Bradyrhizobium sp. USDA 10063]
MNFTATPGAEKFIRFMLRADGASASVYRPAVTPVGYSELSADVAIATLADPASRSSSVTSPSGISTGKASRCSAVQTIDLTDTTAPDGHHFSRS